jgi:hypothetical protein
VAPIDRIKYSGFEVIEAITPDTIHKHDGTSTNTNAELGFPGAVDEGLPAFVTLPVLFPVPAGTTLPMSKSIAQGIPAYMTIVVPGSINRAFEAVIKETNKPIRGMKMAESFHFHVEQQRKDGKLAAMASKWTKEQLDVPIANVVAEFAVLIDSIVSESSSFGYKITIFCFLVVVSTNFHFKKRVSGEQFANHQDLHIESERNKRPLMMLSLLRTT